MKQFLLAAILILVPVALLSADQIYVVKPPAATTVANSALGDLSQFKTIITDVQAIAAKGDLAAAEKRATDFESAWDDAQPKLRPFDSAAWGEIDDVGRRLQLLSQWRKASNPKISPEFELHPKRTVWKTTFSTGPKRTATAFQASI